MQIIHVPENGPRPRRATGGPAFRIAMVLTAALAVIGLCVGLALWDYQASDRIDPADAALLRAPIPQALIAKPVSDPAALRKVSAQEAEKINATIPVSAGPNPAAHPLIVPTGHDFAWTRALDCMTAAVYYEAASETDDGLRAVAQVVLNRVRHPAFPHSVCGVVFQGSERTTGCQFTFTCDGALTRLPSRTGWARAQRIAGEALAGHVYEPVGLSTHYHTDWVSPYWAPTLVKTAVIGAHIFYRWPGVWGKPLAFSARYTADEPVVRPGTNGVTLPEGLEDGTQQASTPPQERQVLSLNGAAFAGVRKEDQVTGTPAPASNAPVATMRWIIPGPDKAAQTPPATAASTADRPQNASTPN